MADISKIKVLDGTTYDIKDIIARRAHDPEPLETKTYTDVIATANDNNGAGFFYLKVRADNFTDSYWHIKTRVKASVPGNANYYTDTTFDLWGFQNTYSWYSCLNRIRTTSYRPIYYNSYFRVSSVGYNNGCGGWVGFNLWYSSNPTTATLKREITVELLSYENCTVELQDELVTPTNIPNRAAHTDWYSSTNTSFDNFDACSYGLKQSGDANTTSISNLYLYNGNYRADSILYRYELLFQTDEDTLTPLNNVSNGYGSTTKVMLTDVEFDPFGRIYYYNTTTTVNPEANIGAGALYWSHSGLDLRYTFNCGTTLTAHKPFYLVVTPTSNGKCKIADDTPWAQDLPTTNDGKWYILLGRTYSAYQMALHSEHPVFCHDGTTIRRVIPPSDAATVNGHTVNSDVPANAKFTDTTYESKAAASGGTALSLVTTGEKYTWNNKGSGTITGIKMNGASKGTSGVVDLGTVITAHQDISGKLNTSLKGAVNGLAELDANGKVPSSQLPSYVDDVLEYAKQANFPSTGETGKIYIDLATNKTYRWSGSAYVEISQSLALGTTSSTAYRGDYGNSAYTHAVTNKGSAFSSGLYKITTNAEGHVTNATAVSKADITALGIPGSDTNTTYTANTSKLVTTTVPNVTSAGSAPTLGTAIPADDITAWTTNTPTAFEIIGEKLKITAGKAATLSYTAKSIPNVTSVGSAPTLGTAITVATGALASNGAGSSVVTGITGT